VFFSGCTKSEETTKKLEFTFPISDELLESGSPFEILWKSTLIENIDLLYSLDKGVTWVNIISNFNASNGKYLWTPKKINQDTVILKLQDHADPNYFVLSGPFELWESASINVQDFPILALVNALIIINNKFFDNFAITNLGNGNFRILSLTCTHAGCSLMKYEDTFECSCHGSIFATSGCVKQGPAIENLPHYYNKFIVSENKLTIFRKQLKTNC
jgi:Rieske Fe-S protein